MTDEPTHYVLINEAGVYTKVADFFVEQGGLTSDWGKAWEPIVADSLYDARRKGIKMRRERFPHSHRTIGEDESLDIVWPEAKGR